MKSHRLLIAAALLAIGSLTSAADGLITVKRPRSAKETMVRLEEVVTKRGLNVFARIDHAAGAAKIRKSLRPTELLIFGNPQGGTPLVECEQTSGIDLPLKALVRENSAGHSCLSDNDPAFLARRHGVPQCPAVASLRKALAAIAEAAAAPQTGHTRLVSLRRSHCALGYVET